MLKRLLSILALLSLALPLSGAWADDYTDTIKIFKNAGESGKLLNTAYGYAVFPTIGKGGVAVGGAYGKGRVYKK
jgi:lipid-binding SYLF domain-containing protein